MLKLSFKIVVWIDDTFASNFEIEMDFTKYLNETCWLVFQFTLFIQIFSQLCFLKIALLLLAAVSINGLALMLLVANLANRKKTETLAHGYSSKSIQQQLSKEYQHDRVLMSFRNLCVLVLWKKIASGLKRLMGKIWQKKKKKRICKSKSN